MTKHTEQPEKQSDEQQPDGNRADVDRADVDRADVDRADVTSPGPDPAPSGRGRDRAAVESSDRRGADAIETDRRGGGRGRRGPRRGAGRYDDERGDADSFDPSRRGGPRSRRGHGSGHGHERGGPRARRGEVRNAVLVLLAEGPQHGYQIIQELGERSGGAWTPSPGSIYPILHRLAAAGVVEAEELEDGRRVFTLTPKGRLAAERLATRGESEPWTGIGPVESDEARELRRLGQQLDGAIGQVAQVATADQLVRAGAIVAEARRKLYAVLAEEPSA